jgi:hypothetical protein
MKIFIAFLLNSLQTYLLQNNLQRIISILPEMITLFSSPGESFYSPEFAEVTGEISRKSF